MKKYRRMISAAVDDNEDTRLKDAISAIDEDYDYVVAGLEKLGRDGSTSYNAALEIADRFESALAEAIAAIADNLQEEI